MNTQIAFAATTEEATHSEKVYSSNPITLIGTGFSGADEIVVQVYDGSTYIDMYQNGVKVALNATNNTATVYGPCQILLNKGVTTGTVGASIAYN